MNFLSFLDVTFLVKFVVVFLYSIAIYLLCDDYVLSVCVFGWSVF